MHNPAPAQISTNGTIVRRSLSLSEQIATALDEDGDDWEATGHERSAGEIIARQLVGLAMSGDKRAVEIILDRCEGKARPIVDTHYRDPDEIVEIG